MTVAVQSRPGDMLEEVAKLAQKYLSKRPVVVLGSGASVPYGLPTMQTLAARLESCIAPAERDSTLWSTFRSALESHEDLERALDTVHLTPSLHNQVVEEVWRCISEHDLAFHHSLITKSRKFPLAELVRYLLRIATPRIDVVTTNYDRVAEYAANVAGAHVYTGFSPGWIQRQTTTLWTKSKRRVAIWKVHGSLDWFREGQDSIVGVPLAETIPLELEPIIVTPGVTKYEQTHKDPFRTVMAQADTVLAAATAFVCVGYGFRDKHVQPKLLERIRTQRVPIVLITKRLTDAARSLLLEGPSDEFLIIEEFTSGSKAYYPGREDGVEIDGEQLWQLPEFLSSLIFP